MQENVPVIQGGELAKGSEARKPQPRFLILGSRISGAYGAADAFEAHLKTLGIEDPKVQAVKNAARIEEAFFDRLSDSNSREDERPNAPEATPSNSSLVRRLTGFITRREVTTPVADEDVSVPDGVVVFPQMRQYLPGGTGMFIPTPREDIQELCDQHGVPVIFMEDIKNQADLASAVDGLTSYDAISRVVEEQ